MNKHGAGNPELGIVQGLSPAPWLSLYPGAGWVVECMPRPGPHKGQHFINTQQPSKHLIHLLFPGFALLDKEEVSWGERVRAVSAEITVLGSLVAEIVRTRAYIRCGAIFTGGKGHFSPKSTVASFTV